MIQRSSQRNKGFNIKQRRNIQKDIKNFKSISRSKYFTSIYHLPLRLWIYSSIQVWSLVHLLSLFLLFPLFRALFFFWAILFKITILMESLAFKWQLFMLHQLHETLVIDIQFNCFYESIFSIYLYADMGQENMDTFGSFLSI